MKPKIMSLVGLMVMGITAAYGSQTDQPKMNGKLKVTTLSPEEIRYTGKPYSKALGAYVFNYRNYDPQLARWTTPDPAGFPDGANNQIYAPVPTFALDLNGLWQLRINGNNSLYETSAATPATVSDSLHHLIPFWVDGGFIGTVGQYADGVQINTFSNSYYIPNGQNGAVSAHLANRAGVDLNSATGKLTFSLEAGLYATTKTQV